MTQTHVPVLAGELIALLDPQPGEIAAARAVDGDPARLRSEQGDALDRPDRDLGRGAVK